jgi:lipoprotein-anchoring transpeptidase ErfK/SrfK
MRFLLLLLFSLVSCTVPQKISRIEISIQQQSLKLMNGTITTRSYPISTSKLGIGDRHGSFKTPLGVMIIIEKIGAGMPANTSFKGRIPCNRAYGRDGIVARILRLHGLEDQNKNVKSRNLYIHGTPFVADIGRAASYGCIRMKPADIIDIFDKVNVGTIVEILKK